MSSPYAYSTDNIEAVSAYRTAQRQHADFGRRIRADVETLGAGPRVYLRNGDLGSPNQITALEQKGDHIPDGWRIVRGHLEPRRGKPGEQARQWLADHQPIDVRHVLVDHGLPRNVWIPRTSGSFSFRIVAPEIFEHEGTLWALYEAEPGVSDSGFDDQKCTWPPRKLSEFYAAQESFKAALAPVSADAA